MYIIILFQLNYILYALYVCITVYNNIVLGIIILQFILHYYLFGGIKRTRANLLN